MGPLFLFSVIMIPTWWSILLLLPSHVDGITQALGWRKSNNYLRAVTGFMAGTAVMSLTSIAGKYVGDLILTWIQ